MFPEYTPFRTGIKVLAVGYLESKMLTFFCAIDFDIAKIAL